MYMQKRVEIDLFCFFVFFMCFWLSLASTHVVICSFKFFSFFKYVFYTTHWLKTDSWPYYLLN